MPGFEFTEHHLTKLEPRGAGQKFVSRIHPTCMMSSAGHDFSADEPIANTERGETKQASMIQICTTYYYCAPPSFLPFLAHRDVFSKSFCFLLSLRGGSKPLDGK